MSIYRPTLHGGVGEFDWLNKGMFHQLDPHNFFYLIFAHLHKKVAVPSILIWRCW